MLILVGPIHLPWHTEYKLVSENHRVGKFRKKKKPVYNKNNNNIAIIIWCVRTYIWLDLTYYGCQTEKSTLK